MRGLRAISTRCRLLRGMPLDSLIRRDSSPMMTEQAWLAEGTLAQHMLWAIPQHNLQRTKAGKRKLRLFAVACARVVWHLLPDSRLQDAIIVAERHAEGLATGEEMAAARQPVEGLRADGALPRGTPVTTRVAVDMAVETTDRRAFDAAFGLTTTVAPLGGRSGGEKTLGDLLRCIFGNPFRPVAFERSWLTATVVALAETAYQERSLPAGVLDPERLAVLSDALEEAGCSIIAVRWDCPTAWLSRAIVP